MQKKLFSVIDDKQNVILTGPGGAGKTYTLRKIACYLTETGRNVCCTATTGVAAINLNIPERKIAASTLHSWGGVGTAKLNVKKLCAKVYQDKPARTRWLTTDVLIIDEVSMLGQQFFKKMEAIACEIRQSKQPFGGIQLVLSGDFLQLPPVKDCWPFWSSEWKSLELQSFIFDQPKRYDDEEYFELLLRIRKGEHNSEDVRTLYSRVSSYDKLIDILEGADDRKVIKPTILYSTKKDVNRRNEECLEKLPGKTSEFIAKDTFTRYNDKAKYERYMNMLDDTIPKVIRLKVGAQVMLKCNIDVQAGFVNGSRGVVLKINEDDDKEPIVIVRFINGKTLRVKSNVWTIEDDNGFASRSQLPFLLAWAFTIHKGQGATLDYAVCDLGPSIFACGQAYVALSRVRNLKGLFISNFVPKAIKVDQEALEYTQILEEQGYTSPTEVEEEGVDKGYILVFESSTESGSDEEGEVRVGRRIYKGRGKYVDPRYPGFTSIIVMTPSTAYGSLSPYSLCDNGGRLMENLWQFSKVYRQVPSVSQTYSHWDNRIIWEHPAETHLDQKGRPTKAYWRWREKGMNAPDAIRYPPGKEYMKTCSHSLSEEGEKLDYIQARKKIYLPLYLEMVAEEPQFLELKERLEGGENLLIIEVDGPHQEDLAHYQDEYDVSADFIESNTVVVNEENMNILLNDEKNAFGHGYCLGMALLGMGI